MRELKFRVWDPAIPKGIKEAEDDKASGDMVNWEYVKKSSYLIDGLNGKYPMMQYTGLKDKNGKEIYEGDIVKYFWLSKEYIKTITWDISRAGFIAGFTIDLGEYDGSSAVEIVGNIYENPELMEAEQ